MRCAAFPARLPLSTTAMKKSSLRSTSNFRSPKSILRSTGGALVLNESRTNFWQGESIPPRILVVHARL
jgi:hypothetical protein